jgi:AcrR family transcriptional regulator
MLSQRVARERKDARRNRERIIEAATRAFHEVDGDTSVSLESIAAAAGVGVGTLYRNFESREALVAEVYRSDLDRLCRSAGELVASYEAVRALRQWMQNYQDFVTTKRGMAEALRALIARGTVTSARTRGDLASALRTILDAGVDDGTLRPDVRPEDIAASLAGAILAATDTEQSARMLDLLVDGCSTK